MGAVSLLLSRNDQRLPRAGLVPVFVAALSLLALFVAVLVTSGVLQPEAEQMVAPFRWFYGDATTA